VAGTAPGSCPVTGYNDKGVKMFSSATTGIRVNDVILKNQQYTFLLQVNRISC
jgi:hypothetical protein